MPLSPYALHKLTGELYCQQFTRLYGLETLVLRYFNVFGPCQDPSSLYAAVIHTAWRTKAGYGPYGVAIRGARLVLGTAFDHWYWEIRGKSYCADVR